MLRFVIRRVLLSLITLLILLIVVTAIPNIAPGDPARKIAGAFASPERLESITESLSSPVRARMVMAAHVYPWSARSMPGGFVGTCKRPAFS